MVFIFSKLNALNGMLISATHVGFGGFRSKIQTHSGKSDNLEESNRFMTQKTVLKSNLEQN